LGLFAVRKIVEAHGGEIRLESVSGQGTVVTIGLPMAQ
jgi:signal transduction histidine kinase